MNRQRNGSTNTIERSIKSIRVVEKPQEDRNKAQPATARRSTSQIKNDQEDHTDQILTQRKLVSKKSSPRANKQNETHKINYQTVISLLKQHQKTSIDQQKDIHPNPTQFKQLEHLHKMLDKLQVKQAEQIEMLKKLRGVPEELENAGSLNAKLKQELYEMKELMKALLLEREEQRMFAFYQDQ